MKVLTTARRGFTLVELSVVCLLTGLLATLMTTTWLAFGRPAVEVASRVRLAREASLAVASLSADLGGGLPGPRGWAGSKKAGRLVGMLAPGTTQIRLCYDFGEDGTEPDGIANWAAPDYMVSYELLGSKLIRHDLTSYVDATIANDVDSLVTQVVDNHLIIQITFRYREFQRTYTLEAIAP